MTIQIGTRMVVAAAALLIFPCTNDAGQDPPSPAPADPAVYLAELTQLCIAAWPKNRTINIVCHGHSVPAGYFKTPEVRSLNEI